MNLILWIAWGFLYALCLALSLLVPLPAGLVKAAMTAIGVIFFVPGTLLLVDGFRRRDRALIKKLRLIGIVSLALTTAGLVAFFMCGLLQNTAAADIAFYALAAVSQPMLCAQYWGLSLFLWAALTLSTFLQSKITD